ncbi:MAG TPA: hypothetical protein VJN94_17435 [Candidatus Binataceae bacterium]|nr:hypothetical protein [Candidatus Binataceae bacterium]
MTEHSSTTARRNRIIAIAAGLITVVAVVLGFAGDVLGLPWHWMRPAAELLLLAELVGLVVLERHQLFEPVHETVGDTHALVQQLHTMMKESARASGQVTACTSTPEVYRTMIRVAREALARDQQSPQMFRLGRLAGRLGRSADVQEDPDLFAELQEWFNAMAGYYLTPGSPPDYRARRWSVRQLIAFASLKDFDLTLEQGVRQLLALKPTNLELKVLVRPRIEAMLSPAVMTDRDALMIFDDATAGLRWGVLFQGPQYLVLFQRWFDDLWATLPDNHLIYSRNGFNEGAIDRIRKELEASESAVGRQTA